MVFDGPRGKKDYVKTSFCFLTLSADPKRTDILRSPKGIPYEHRIMCPFGSTTSARHNAAGVAQKSSAGMPWRQIAGRPTCAYSMATMLIADKEAAMTL